MKTTIASARVGPEESKLLDELAKFQGLDRSTLMRQLLQLGIRTYRENAAIMAYANEQATLGRAAALAGVPQWEMLGLLEKHHVELNYDARALERDFQSLKKQ